MKKVLVVAVHPDDETLGSGGTLLKHAENGDEIHWLICTEINVDSGFSAKKVAKRKSEIDTVAKMYGFTSVHNLQLNTMRVDEYKVSELVSKISDVFNQVKPNTIYLPFKSDIHSDHRVIFDAAYSCTKSFRHPYVKNVYMIETLSETEFAPSTKEDSFVPNVYIDISKHMNRKIEIMKVFESELGKHPFPRSIETIQALATFRGAAAGCYFAESFMLLKEIK